MDATDGPRDAGKRFGAAELELIERYVAGELPPAEAEAFAQRVSSNPELAALVQALTAIWNGDDPGTPSFDVQALWARVLPRVRARRRFLSLHRHDATKPSSRAWWASPRLLATAALAMVAIGAAGWLNALRYRRYDAARPKVRELSGRQREPEMREFSTSKGERADLRLDDGSQIVLGAATTIRIPNDFGDRTRDVYLDGEAYFVVRHDPKRPFEVHAGRILVRDVGTRFAVTAYGGIAPTRVVVAEGVVAVARVELRQNDLAIVDSSGMGAAVQHGVDASAAIGWTEGRLTFNRAAFADVAASLGRWYDLDIRLADPVLAHQPLTVSFGSESLRQVLDAIALLTHSRYEQHGRTTTFYARGTT